MKNRLFMQPQKKNPSFLGGMPTGQAPICISIGNQDVIAAKVSDHHPVVHDNVIFWNVMMQGRQRQSKHGIGYNNAFGMVESEQMYLQRLVKIAAVIAELVSINPNINKIGLCEGPIQSNHVATLIDALKKYEPMKRFFKNKQLHTSQYTDKQNWGLLMLADEKYTVNLHPVENFENSDYFAKLANRLQLWKLSTATKNVYFGLAHFPFAGGDELLTEKNKFSADTKTYIKLISTLLDMHQHENFNFCADFNFNPHLMTYWKDRALDCIPANNSILINDTNAKETTAVTVDGILLSLNNKRKYYHQHVKNKLQRSANQSNFLDTLFNRHVIDNRHINADAQHHYDRRYGLVKKY